MRVLNRRIVGLPPGATYIGRGSPWGNEFKIGRAGDRDQVIAKFEAQAAKRHALDPSWLEPLRGRDLVCYCAPERCHGDVIIKLLGETKT